VCSWGILNFASECVNLRMRYPEQSSRDKCLCRLSWLWWYSTHPSYRRHLARYHTHPARWSMMKFTNNLPTRLWDAFLDPLPLEVFMNYYLPPRSDDAPMPPVRDNLFAGLRNAEEPETYPIVMSLDERFLCANGSAALR
jgi:hypothetical protein